MKYLLAGGGTAGHINPAIAIATVITEKEPDAQILFVGNEGGMEQKLVAQAGFDFKTIKISGFSRKLTPKAFAHNIKTAARALTATIAAGKIIKEFAPDYCIGTGGYVSGPVIKAAIKAGIKTAVHEQNAFPGVTTKMLSKNAGVVMLAQEGAKAYLNKKSNCVLTGNPLKKEIITAKKPESRAKLKIDNCPLVLSFGGSLGARKINEAMAPFVARSGKDGKYNHIHAYGRYGTWFPSLVKEQGINIEKCVNLDVREFINNMPTCMAAADLLICRAGAITISELQALGKPAILIPSPNVAENHQYHNAMELVKAGAAEVIEEKNLTPELLIKTADRLLKNKEKLELYGQNAKKMALINANERIYRTIKNL